MQETPSPFILLYLANFLSSDFFLSCEKINALFQNAEENWKI